MSYVSFESYLQFETQIESEEEICHIKYFVLTLYDLKLYLITGTKVVNIVLYLVSRTFKTLYLTIYTLNLPNTYTCMNQYKMEGPC